MQNENSQQIEKVITLDEFAKILPKQVLNGFEKDVTIKLHVGKKADSGFSMELNVPSVLILSVVIMLHYFPLHL